MQVQLVFYIFAPMKKYFWLFVLTAIICSCAETQDEKATPLMSDIESLYGSGQYKQTLDSIMTLRKNFPEAIDSRKRALKIWQNASLKMAQQDIARTDSALQATLRAISSTGNIGKRNMLGVKRDSLKARYEAMCGVVRMIHYRQSILFVAMALMLFNQAGLLVGGTAGVAFLLHYVTGISFGKLFFVVNLPFYWFAWTRMGREFTVKTFVCVALLSLLTELFPHVMHVDYLNPLFASLLGGLLLGTGCLFLARHRSSLGGATIVSLYMQNGFVAQSQSAELVASRHE